MSAKWERDSEASKGTLTFEIDVETAKKGIDQAFKRTQNGSRFLVSVRATCHVNCLTKCTVKKLCTKML